MSLFDNEMWYILLNKSLGRNFTLNSGNSMNTNGSLAMGTALKTSSSENWQMFSQDGRYFIRNWDYRGLWQLGVNTNDRLLIPKLMDWQTDLSQQWLVEKQDDGYFKITNQALGLDRALGIGIADSAPQMTTNMDQALWYIDPNLSAVNAGPVDDFFLASMQIVEPKPTSTSSLPASSSDAVSTSPPSTIATTSGTATSTGRLSAETSSTDPNLTSSQSTSLSSGAIAGIAVGAVAIVLVAALAFFLLRRRRRPRSSHHPPDTLPKSFDYKDSPQVTPAAAPKSSAFVSTSYFDQNKPPAQDRTVYHEKPGNSTAPGELESPLLGQGQKRSIAELDGGGGSGHR